MRLTYLQRAILRHDVARVRDLITKGVDVEKCYDGVTPLEYAVDESQEEISEMLITAGANIWVRDAECGDSLLHTAALRGSAPLAALFLGLGIPANDHNFRGDTPLLNACRTTDDTNAVVSLLLANGATTCVRSRFMGLTPIIEAARYCKPLVVHELIRHGADVYAIDDNGETALSAAWNNECQDVIDVLTVVTGDSM